MVGQDLRADLDNPIKGLFLLPFPVKGLQSLNLPGLIRCTAFDEAASLYCLLTLSGQI